LRETIWSLKSPRAKRINGPKKFRSSPKKDFFVDACLQMNNLETPDRSWIS